MQNCPVCGHPKADHDAASGLCLCGRVCNEQTKPRPHARLNAMAIAMLLAMLPPAQPDKKDGE